jgi:8-amino-7-oxononanoate synthase
MRQALGQPAALRPGRPSTPATGGRREFDFTTLPEYEILKIWKAVGDITRIGNPFYRLHDGRAGNTTSIDGRTVANFSSL